MYHLIEIMIIFLIVILILALSIRIFKEYERGVLFRLGRLKGAIGPGIVFVIPFIDKVIKVDQRLISIDVPRQEVMTKDNVPITVDAVVYFHIVDPVSCVVKVHNYYQSTFLIAQTILRSVLGSSDLDEVLSEREKINKKLQENIDKQTDSWGVKVPLVEIKEVTLPEEMKRAIARQAEAERIRRAKIIDAEGELQSAEKIVQAANILSSNPTSLQLKYLRTLADISVYPTNKIIFPLPIELISQLLMKQKEK